MIELSKRQKEVLECLKRGMTDKEISCNMCVNLETIKMHETVLRRKFGVKNRLQLVLKAIKENL